MFGYFDLVFFVPEVALLLAIRSATTIADGLTPHRAGTAGRVAMTWLTTSTPAHGRAGHRAAGRALGGLFTYVRFFREEPPPFFASDEEHFLYGSVGTEAEQGVPYWIWLVLPRIFPEYLPGARRIRVDRRPRARRPRDADRPLEGDGRLSPRRHQLRDVPRGELPREAGRCADHLSGGRVASDGRAGIPAVPHRMRVGPALHAGHHPRRDREEHAAVVHRPTAVPLRDHSGHAPRAFCACGTTTRG